MILFVGLYLNEEVIAPPWAPRYLEPCNPPPCSFVLKLKLLIVTAPWKILDGFKGKT